MVGVGPGVFEVVEPREGGDAEIGDEIGEVELGPHVEVVGGLVEHDQRRLLGEGPGDQHPLVLTTRERVERSRAQRRDSMIRGGAGETGSGPGRFGEAARAGQGHDGPAAVRAAEGDVRRDVAGDRVHVDLATVGGDDHQAVADRADDDAAVLLDDQRVEREGRGACTEATPGNLLRHGAN
jgi:hypothetical protein